jgi:hypothetical protein
MIFLLTVRPDHRRHLIKYDMDMRTIISVFPPNTSDFSTHWIIDSALVLPTRAYFLLLAPTQQLLEVTFAFYCKTPRLILQEICKLLILLIFPKIFSY